MTDDTTTSSSIDLHNNDDDLMQSFLTALAHPEQELLPLLLASSSSQQQQQQDKRRLLQQVCQYLFQQVEHFARLQQQQQQQQVERKSDHGAFSLSTLSGLQELYCNSETTDAETLWGQAELQNQALYTLLKKNVKKLCKTVDSQESLRLLNMGDIMSEDEERDEDSDDDDSSSEDEESRRIRQRMERAMQDMDDDSDNNDDSDLHDEDDELDTANDHKQNNQESDMEDPAAEELNDGFFDIHEMEAFADEEEDYLPQDAFGTVRPETDDEAGELEKKSFHQRQREGDVDDNSGDGSDSEHDDALAFKTEENPVKRRKYRQDAEIEALYKLYQEAPQDMADGDEDDADDDVVNMTAADFFGKPNKKYYEQYYSGKKQGRKASPKVDMNDDDADSWDNHDFDNDDGPGWRDNDVSGDSKKVTFGDDQVQEYDNEGEGGEVDGDDGGEDDAPPKASASSSAHARQTEKLRHQTEQLEKELLAEKPWQMTGESKGTSRPVNSLLEATPEFEVATKMAPLITVEHTAKLEDVIRQRILNEDWDDVVPRELPDVAWNKKRGELPEVSQEKSKLGLGELYEREYLKKAAGYDVDAAEKQSDEEKARSEMKALFANLCSKLDALSNYHFAPRPVADEAEVRAVTTPAIAMEEVLPLHVSDARGVAPEEVYGKKKGRDGVLRGDTELDQAERKRLRNAKKAARRKARKAKLADEKLISRLEPGLGLNNPYEKRKMREELSMARSRGKITTGERDMNADYGASGKFFKRIQEQVEQDVREDGSDTKKRKYNDEGRNRKSSSFKL